MKLFAILSIAASISATAALPMPKPINWMLPSFIPLEDCKVQCCGFACFPGMFVGLKRSNSDSTTITLA